MALSNQIALDKKIYVGIDVHKNSYSVCTVDEQLNVKSVRMPADPEALTKWLLKGYRNCEISSVYEAGFSGFALHRVLVKAGIRNIVVNPASIPIAANERVKTDKRDAKNMAFKLKIGDLKGIYVPSLEEELFRLLPRTRAQLVKESTRIGNQIKSKLFQFGYIKADDDREMSLKLLKEFETMELPGDLKYCIEMLAQSYRFTRSQIAKVTLQMRKQAKEKRSQIDAIYRSVPGIGPVSAVILQSELGDLSRFSNERKAFSFTGLTPGESSSGDKERKGHITKQGNTRVRHCLIEVSWRAIQKDMQLRKKYEELKKRCGGKRAIVGIARRLVGRIRACNRDLTEYHPQLKAA
jgi:transposase